MLFHVATPWTVIHGILQARILEQVAFSSGDIPNPEMEPRSPALQADSLPAEPQGKTKDEDISLPLTLQTL